MNLHQFHNGLYTESCFVLAEGEIAATTINAVKKMENGILCNKLKTIKHYYKHYWMQIFAICPAGWYEDSVFHVNGFGFPPTEPSSATRLVFKYTLRLMKSRLFFIYILLEFFSFGSFFH